MCCSTVQTIITTTLYSYVAWLGLVRSEIEEAREPLRCRQEKASSYLESSLSNMTYCSLCGIACQCDFVVPPTG